MKVLLVCAAGMSTSILMKKLEKYAEEQGIEFSISATGWANAKDACGGVDCVLMGPQVAYQKANVEAMVGGIPVAVIPPQDYGMGNCKSIFDLIDELLGK
ncbi:MULTISPECIES: PTS sugar transporter subunit IIB [Enorma]|uniref:PTS sugar transporter subunit IIB n=1 Tax=[Collinsella] massiliensis TaxID=1232426 RepID=A0A1Y3XT42_9ACTN|nr:MULTISPECIES: PTS sugar transporter subunit IIB [Enorma]OUN88714.1 PTS sugar transporter subunit IIB [[Collinsella] massiliensis]